MKVLNHVGLEHLIHKISDSYNKLGSDIGKGLGQRIENTINITYAELVSLRDNDMLKPGQQYRIIDYETTTGQEDTRSALHRFDIIVTAIDNKTLSEEALAAPPTVIKTINVTRDKNSYTIPYRNIGSPYPDSNIIMLELARYEPGAPDILYVNMFNGIKIGSQVYTNVELTTTFGIISNGQDLYFENNKLNAWKIWYCLDNDINRFTWAGASKPDINTYKLTINGVTEDVVLENGSNTYRQWFYFKHTNGYAYTTSSMPDNNTTFYNEPESSTKINVDLTYDSILVGKGVIYRMIDEFENDCSYDFKNIQFKRKLTDGVLDTENGVDTWCYTFNAYCIDDNKIYDASVIAHKVALDDDTNRCYGNNIKEYYLDANNKGSKLNDIVFLNVYSIETETYFQCSFNSFGSSCFSNSFGNSCYSNSFGNICYENSFGDYFNSNSFGNSCIGNSFKDNCINNSFGYGCHSNSFGNDCYNNSFGNINDSNSFGNSCIGNSFKDNCTNNSFGYGCHSNSFGNGCYRNSFGIECYSNSFGNDCNYNSLGKNCTSNSFINECYENRFGEDCDSNSFGNNCYENSFGNCCAYNSFGNFCTNNSFIDECRSNVFGNDCYENVFTYKCSYNSFRNGCHGNYFVDRCCKNSFGNYCYSNSFGNECYSNSFGNDCYLNSFGNYCSYNSFGNDCDSNSFYVNADNYSTLKDYVQYNHFDDGCSYNVIWNSDTTSSTVLLKNININRGVVGTSSSYNYINVKLLNSEQEININNYNGHIYIEYGDIFKVTYDELVDLRDNSQLIPGRQYRIIDYITTTSKQNTQSAGHPFDIIVTALDECSLSEEAQAVQNFNDSYFDNSNLSAWKIWYCLDNDINKFDWAANEITQIIYDSSECTINSELVDGNVFITPFNFESCVWVDANDDGNAYVGESNHDEEELIYEWGYFTDENDNTQLCLYKSDAGLYEEEGQPDYGDKYLYRGVVNVDGTDYDYWQKWDNSNNENGGFNGLNITGNYVYATTVRIVSNPDAYIGSQIKPKGIIYRMIDEFNNDCPYDFKNIQFRIQDNYIYTFSMLNSDENIIDASLNINPNLTESLVANNTIKPLISLYWNESDSCEGFKQYLNLITFFAEQTFIAVKNNTFDYNCEDIYINGSCSSNVFGPECSNISLGPGCDDNYFASQCRLIHMSNHCYSNKFDLSCVSISIGSSCIHNKFGIGCNEISLGNNCDYNNFMDNCTDIFFKLSSSGSFTSHNIRKYTNLDYCNHNLVDTGCNYVAIWNNEQPTEYNPLQNLHISKVTSNSYEDFNNVQINEYNIEYELKVAKNSSGEIKVYCEADLIV